ncbi:MAG: 2-hydroxyacid dehydrogenase [Burkholderiales bacterium]|nr:MAG: 2-hydroxyacid dehydrogenase [Burkholderiales bacterium]
MSAPNILAVSQLSPLYLAHLNAHFTVHDRLHVNNPEQFKAIAPQIRAIAASGESKVPASLIELLPKLEIISVFGVGYDGVDVQAAIARGAKVTHTPNVLNDDVADLAIGLMLAAARQLPASDVYVKTGTWAEKGPMPLARKVSGARVGIVGMGRIGQAIAKRAAAFDMSIAYTSRNARADVPFKHYASATELAAVSDYLVVITPGGATTKHLINAEVLKALGKKGILVNVARGSVVDEAALISALVDGTIGGAGLDVFENEPNVPQALRDMPHVVLSPHIGSATTQTRQAMADLAFGNLQSHFAGQALLTPVPECM